MKYNNLYHFKLQVEDFIKCSKEALKKSLPAALWTPEQVENYLIWSCA